MNSDEQLAPAGKWAGWVRDHRLFAATCGHLVLFAVSWLLAFGLAYNFRRIWTEEPAWLRHLFLPLLPVVLVVKAVVFGVMGLNRASWRYVSMRDVFQVTKAAFISFAWLFAVYYGLVNVEETALLLGFEGFTFEPFGGRNFPDSVLILDFAGTIALVCGARFAVRLYHEEIQPLQEGSTPKLLILGAGDAGENVAREILRLPVLQYRVVGFLDDDKSKWGTQIHGIEVLGGIDQTKEICAEHLVDEILIAMPSATRKQVRRVVELCQGTSLRFKTLPAIADLIAGRAQVQQIRDVDINDLLGRAPVVLDTAGIAEFLDGRVVMVTGAGGSIGSEMCRQVARFAPKRLLLVEQAEQNLFEIDRELRAGFPDIDVVPYIADIGDAKRIGWIFQQEHATAVFHAAAHKHVPMMELNPGEALKNNILGTRTVADAASRNG
ncbi:MAG: polysaccharide biosynthesis protein [Planctomycetes bacterium]|nr:polysaccharide biosynthesis protein [Planctomycetota bacterium]